MGITIFQSIAYYQIMNVGMVWINDAVDLSTPLGAVPVAWFNSIDSFVSIIAVPPLVLLWARQARRGNEPDDVAKIGIGAALCAASAGLLALGALMAGNGKASILVPVAAWTGMGVAFLYYWPPYLALISRAAPAKVNGTLMGVAFISLFVGNIVIGWVGTFYEKLTPARFWTLDASIAAIGAIIVLILGRPLSRAFATLPSKQDPSSEGIQPTWASQA